MKYEKLDGMTDLIDGTFYQGNVRTTYDHIVEVLGEPSADGDGGDKVRAEWFLLFEDGKIATIYDWKENVGIQLVTDWHIGGLDRVVVDRVRRLLK